MSDYSTITAAIIHQAKKLENTLPIKNEACRPKFFFHPEPTPKICLFFHGFTAGPYQFEPLGKALFEAGYNVLVPLQPGHGVAGKWDKDNPPPLPSEIEIYQQFALSWLEVAQKLGDKVIVGGLSTGGNLAAWLALERPQQIERSLLFAPSLRSNNAIVDFLIEVLPIYYEWLNKDNSGNFGYDGFLIPSFRIFLDMGKEILERVEKEPTVPMFVTYSESDRAINHHEIEILFEALLKQQPKSWYHRFDKSLEIPHTMMTKAEGNKYQDLLITLAKAYVESNITWDELIKIGYQILQGKTFEAAVNELDLVDRVTPDLSVLLAVMDDKMIIDSYK
ncbi:alpha/beta fold hydrolase [Plectonema radiosum NIES-515]|uniref:Alpha/beta fold hydrolase n=1 Tax=Plectonema radiosum NIES-515 TaxID=2986073 RepID=A0ABT3AVU5_9CYAN|nr:alpha/beta fold hydrolase [Plectonema radiosum]MCV3213247.1 alpha/beta fold hydrolase [Plectonema radiosum NIES-515]